MRDNEFREALKVYSVFSVNDIRKVDGRFNVRGLVEWQGKGRKTMVFKTNVGVFIYHTIRPRLH